MQILRPQIEHLNIQSRVNIIIVPPNFIDQAWFKEGADCLEEACATVEDITGGQLKMMLSRGERHLARLDENGKPVGWGCFQIDQLPNLRVLHISALVSHNHGFQRFFEEMKTIARSMGCSEIRCSCKPAQARLFKRTNEFEEVFTTLRVKL